MDVHAMTADPTGDPPGRATPGTAPAGRATPGTAPAGRATHGEAPGGRATPAKVSLSDVSLWYRTGQSEHFALRDVALDLADGEFLSIVGPSGCGKSTLLKLVAGLLEVSAGRVMIDGVPKRPGVPPDVGLVFQNDALLPWRTVLENVRLPLVGTGLSKADQVRRVGELLEVVNLSAFAGFFPGQLSGGMRKRVALARTLAYDPDLFLMDEPFGPLDAQTRIRLGGEFLEIWEGVGKSVMFVTHDVEEAIALSDRVVVMSAAPGTIKAEFRIDLPRPRDFYEVRFEPAFKELHRRIWHSLSEEHGTDE